MFAVITSENGVTFRSYRAADFHETPGFMLSEGGVGPTFRERCQRAVRQPKRPPYAVTGADTRAPSYQALRARYILYCAVAIGSDEVLDECRTLQDRNALQFPLGAHSIHCRTVKSRWRAEYDDFVDPILPVHVDTLQLTRGLTADSASPGKLGLTTYEVGFCVCSAILSSNQAPVTSGHDSSIYIYSHTYIQIRYSVKQ